MKEVRTARKGDTKYCYRSEYDNREANHIKFVRAPEEKEKMLMEDEQKSAMGEVRLFAVLLFCCLPGAGSRVNSANWLKEKGLFI